MFPSSQLDWPQSLVDAPADEAALEARRQSQPLE